MPKLAGLWGGGALCALLALGACSIWVEEEPAAPPPPPTAQSAPSLPAPRAVEGVALEEPPAPAPQATTTPPEDPNQVTVRGVIERQAAPPADPRSTSERMADIRAWDQCVMRIQNAGESDPLRPQLDTPEDVCRQRLGMSSRLAIPDSRRD